ncbi:MAG: DUF2267 domain-containing protein [Candidatus Abyssobacteria bacterium SURF_5]|uniref:DUF2267 domain-containing protein n=1 Tax=Abyssobacteria bacterium (strain SURF_5) TaxID=2093360 RepID=A0A3A4P5J5_ABYX5|nr:MAG: DUF2267 domain-containing protein [Candidatus Abyssubacteria bacterium SURF_5]
MGMEYDRFIEEVKNLEFIPNRDTADAAVKAVLGILASRLEEAEAQKLVEKLPGPLTLERLRGHQVRPEKISVEEYIIEIAQQFRIAGDQAETLIKTVLHLAKDLLGDETMSELEHALPSDWKATIESA